MQHPEVVDPAHPLVERVRAICLAYPESVEVEAWGRPTFRAGKKIFIMVSASMDRPFSIVFKPDSDERGPYLQDGRFFSPPYWGPGGWLATDLDQPGTDWTELGEIIDTSYRQVALVRQIKALDAAGGRNGPQRLV
ncbi:MmcQ/YjbR family DNA-binding protein [Conyzicola sp.]|uniref:MmcQ/YjbR family DNA-binding protein n=1 Tax=Conyzicola sp. TaxID=1969404 RepID=UPI003988ED01